MHRLDDICQGQADREIAIEPIPRPVELLSGTATAPRQTHRYRRSAALVLRERGSLREVSLYRGGQLVGREFTTLGSAEWN